MIKKHFMIFLCIAALTVSCQKEGGDAGDGWGSSAAGRSDAADSWIGGDGAGDDGECSGEWGDD